MRLALPAIAAIALAACGYHVGGHPTILPKTIKTIAVPAFANGTPNYRLPALLTADVTRELISRTRYNVIADPDQADATLSGGVPRHVNRLADHALLAAAAAGLEVVDAATIEQAHDALSWLATA